MEFCVVPLKGVNKVEFGMSHDNILQHFDGEITPFRRSDRDSFSSDYLKSEGVFFYYDGDGQLEAIEFASPAQPSIENLKLIGFGFDKAIVQLSALDSKIKKDVDSVISYRLGVSIYAPLAKDNISAPVESLLAFRPGYYN